MTHTYASNQYQKRAAVALTHKYVFRLDLEEGAVVFDPEFGDPRETDVDALPYQVYVKHASQSPNEKWYIGHVYFGEEDTVEELLVRNTSPEETN